MNKQTLSTIEELRAKKAPASSIAKTLNKQNLLKPHGTKWSAQDIYNLIWRQRRKALTQSGQSIANGTHSPITAQSPNQPPLQFIIKALNSPELTDEQKTKLLKAFL